MISTGRPRRAFVPRPRLLRLVWLALIVALSATACAAGSSDALNEVASSSGDRFPTPLPTSGASTAVAAETDGATVAPETSAEAVSPEDLPTAEPSAQLAPEDVVAKRLKVNVLSERPHQADSFTQGILLDAEGRMFESTGLYGPSITRLMELDPLTGEPIREVLAPEGVWGEGLALVDDRFVQLTYTSKTAYVWDKETFEKIGEFRYDTAGWGLCYDEITDRLVMSDGSENLVFRDPDTFAPISSVPVVLDGVILPRVNELECVDGTVWANVFTTDLIVQIDLETGAVITAVDASSLNQPRSPDTGAVLNGIAYDQATGNFLVTGKLWDTLYEVEFVPL